MKIIWDQLDTAYQVQQETYLQTTVHNIFCYSKLKGGLNKHRDVKKKKDGTSKFLPGTPIVSVTISHPKLFEVYAPVGKDSKDTYSRNAVTKCYKYMVSAIIMSHGQVLI
jgi:hypothetical protein